MQAIDLKVLRQLQERLLEELCDSAYLHPIGQSKYSKIDLASIETLHANSLLRALLNKSNFSWSIDTSSKQNKNSSEALRDQAQKYFDSLLSKKSANTPIGLALGFPMIQINPPQKSIKTLQAPLFLWNLQLQHDTDNVHHWTLLRNSRDPIRINPVLEYYLKHSYDLTIDSPYAQLMDDFRLDINELAQYITKLLHQLQGTKTDSINTIIQKIQGAMQAVDPILAPPTQSTTAANFVATGFISYFGSTKLELTQNYAQLITQLSIKKTPLIEQNETSKNPRSSFMKHPFLVSGNSMYGQQCLYQLYKGQQLIIDAPDQDESAKVLAEIITNVLSNAGTCLIISDNSRTLNTIKQQLAAFKMEELYLLVDESQGCIQSVASSINKRALQDHPSYQVPAEFISVLKNCLSLSLKIQQFQDKNDRPIHADATWTTVAEQLIEVGPNRAEPLNAHLNKASFAFDTTEYEHILSIIDVGEGLFRQLGSLQHPLNALHDRFFKLANVSEVKRKIQSSLQSIQKVVRAAQQDILSYLFDYEQLLEHYFSEVYIDMTSQADKIVDIIEAGLKKSSYYFSKDRGIYQKMLSKVSHKYAQLEQDKKTVLLSYYDLQLIHQRYSYFDFNFKVFTTPEQQDFEVLMLHVEDYKIAAYDWYATRSNAVHQLVKDLSPNNLYKSVPFANQVRQLSRNLDAFQRQFSESTIFKIAFSFATQNIRKRLTQIEQLDKNLDKLQQTFDNFADYHALKHFSTQLDTAQYEVFIGLCESKSDNWSASFRQWYLNALLLQHEDAFVPDASNYELYSSLFSKEIKRLQAILPTHTLRYWSSKQGQEIRHFERMHSAAKIEELYQANKYTLQQIMEASLELFLSFYPLIAANASSCARLIPMQVDKFDLVVIDRAQHKTIEACYAAALRGKYKIVLGDPAQPKPTEYIQKTIQNSSLNYLNQMVWDTASETQRLSTDNLSLYSFFDYYASTSIFSPSFLPICSNHRQRYLLDFSNTVFYNSQLNLSASKSDQSLLFQAINCKQSKDKTTSEEAFAIIKVLTQLAQSASIPSVAIVTFSEIQHHIVLQELENCQKTNSLLQEGIASLYKHGLQLYSFPHFPTTAVDILLLSTADVLLDTDSSVSQLDPIKAPFIPPLINACCFLTQQYMQVFHAAPTQDVKDFKDLMMASNDKNSRIFYGFLAYSKAVQSSVDQGEPTAILDKLSQLLSTTNRPEKAAKNYFWESTVRQFLQRDHASLQLLSNIEHKQQTIPFAIVDALNRPLVALCTDLTDPDKLVPSFIWNLHLQQSLEKENIPLLRVWSKEWWQNKNRAVEKLIQQLSSLLQST